MLAVYQMAHNAWAHWQRPDVNARDLTVILYPRRRHKYCLIPWRAAAPRLVSRTPAGLETLLRPKLTYSLS